MSQAACGLASPRWQCRAPRREGPPGSERPAEALRGASAGDAKDGRQCGSYGPCGSAPAGHRTWAAASRRAPRMDPPHGAKPACHVMVYRLSEGSYNTCTFTSLETRLLYAFTCLPVSVCRPPQRSARHEESYVDAGSGQSHQPRYSEAIPDNDLMHV